MMKASYRARAAIGLLVVMLTVASAQAQRVDSAILEYERIGHVEISRGDVSFVAFGRQFDLRLRRNQALENSAGSRMDRTGPQLRLWQGTLANVPNSWVRLTTRGSALSGIIWDGQEFYAVESYARAAPRLASPSSGAPDDIVVYPVDRSIAPLSDFVLPQAKQAAPLSKPSAQRLSPQKLAPGDGLEIAIALVADAEFAEFAEQTVLSDAVTEMLSIANVVDAIFVQQLGVRIRVADLIVLDAEPDPFTTSSPPALLNEVENYKQGNADLSPLGLVHLITARDLDDVGANETAGIANLGVLCEPRLGVSLAQATFGMPVSALVVAHELGHNFGAPHDGVPGSACATTPTGYLMAPIISFDDQFSQCSIDQMLSEVSTATCLTPLPSSEVSLEITRVPSKVLAGASFDIEFSLDSIGIGDVFAVDLSLQNTPNARITHTFFPTRGFDDLSCTDDAQTAHCTLYVLADNSSMEFTIRYEALEVGTITASAHATALNDTDATNNDVTAVIDAATAVRLKVRDFERSLDVARIGEIVNVSFEALNDGVIDATSVEMEIRPPSFLELDSVNAPEGSACRFVAIPRAWYCPIGTLIAGQPKPVSLALRALDPDSPPGTASSSYLYVVLTALERDINFNRSASTALTVAPVLADATLTIDGPLLAEPGDAVEFTVVVENLGPDTIPGATLSFRNPGMVIADWEAPSAMCSAEPPIEVVECEVGPTAAGETHQILVRGSASELGPYVASYDFKPMTWPVTKIIRSGTFSWRVVQTLEPPQPPAQPRPTPTPSPPGGGGALNLGTLILLACAAALAACGERYRKPGYRLARPAKIGHTESR